MFIKIYYCCYRRCYRKVNKKPCGSTHRVNKINAKTLILGIFLQQGRRCARLTNNLGHGPKYFASPLNHFDRRPKYLWDTPNYFVYASIDLWDTSNYFGNNPKPDKAYKTKERSYFGSLELARPSRTLEVG